MPAQNPASSTMPIGVLLDVIDDDPLRLDARLRAQRIQDQPRPLPLVLEVRRVDEDQLLMLRGEADVLLEDLHFIARIFIEPDLADPEHVLAVEKAGDHCQHFPGEADVLGFLGIDAEP